MRCLSITELTDSTLNLLTHAEKTALLDKKLIRYRRKSDLFMPDDDFYTGEDATVIATRMADELFKWMGVKHKSVTIHLDSELSGYGSYSKSGSDHRITLGLKSIEDPFVMGGVLSHLISHYLLIARCKAKMSAMEDDEAMADLATIYLGFGLLVLNGLSHDPNILGEHFIPNYISEFNDYVSQRGLVPSLWQPYLLHDSVKLLELKDIPPERYKKFSRVESDTLETVKKRNILLGVSILLLVFVSTYLLLIRPKYASLQLLNQRETVELLRLQYMKCADTVSRKKETWDNNDIFMSRQIENDESRCQSLRNRHNYEADKYNQMTEKE